MGKVKLAKYRGNDILDNNSDDNSNYSDDNDNLFAIKIAKRAFI